MMNVYGLKVSYFTGKLEGYLRYKEIPHQFHSMTAVQFRKTVPQKTGAMQMPAVELPDGRWMSDTSPMIDWFETQYPEHPIVPSDPVQAYVCRLIEDYADEWLWRPAMHYRWSYPACSKLLRRQIVEEIAGDVPLPEWFKRIMTERRQHSNFVVRDGVNRKTWDHVERGYLNLLEILAPVFDARPFVFGNRPTLADIGLFGPLFRHFSMDPVPAAIMRETAPAVMEWVYRLWNAKASRIEGENAPGIPDDILPLLTEIGETHLQNLSANAQGWSRGDRHFDVILQGTQYTEIPVSRYRVWCLETLQERFGRLDENARDRLHGLLASQGCLEPLFTTPNPASGYDPDRNAPFGVSIPVYDNVKG